MQANAKKNKGGKREGAGRKPYSDEQTKQVNVTLPISVAEKLKRLGGRLWLIEQIKRAQETAL